MLSITFARARYLIQAKVLKIFLLNLNLNFFTETVIVHVKHFTFGLQLGNFTTKQLKEMQKKKFPDAQEREKWLTAFISDKTPALYELVSNCTICFFFLILLI